MQFCFTWQLYLRVSGPLILLVMNYLCGGSVIYLLYLLRHILLLPRDFFRQLCRHRRFSLGCANQLCIRFFLRYICGFYIISYSLINLLGHFIFSVLLLLQKLPLSLRLALCPRVVVGEGGLSRDYIGLIGIVVFIYSLARRSFHRCSQAGQLIHRTGGRLLRLVHQLFQPVHCL